MKPSDFAGWTPRGLDVLREALRKAIERNRIEQAGRKVQLGATKSMRGAA